MNLLVCSSNIMLKSDLYSRKLTLIFHFTFSFVGIGAELVGFAISLSNCSSFWPASILFYNHSCLHLGAWQEDGHWIDVTR